MTRPVRLEELTLSQQLVNLRQTPLTRGAGGIEGGRRLSWRYEARPSPISRLYALHLTYERGGIPNVLVENPDLVALAAGRRIPHIYSETPLRLCLYLPGCGEWRRNLLFTRTIAPWSILWLWYFEDWLATGEWLGGGVHPSFQVSEAIAPRWAPTRAGGSLSNEGVAP